MPTGNAPDQRGPILFLVLLVLVGLLVLAWGVNHPAAGRAARRAGAERCRGPRDAAADRAPPAVVRTGGRARRHRPRRRARDPLPGGGTRVFEGNRFLVAYYGTAQTGALGVLGETVPGPDGPPAAPRGRAVPPARPAAALRLRADRDRRRRPPGPGRRLQPRHPARGGAALHRGRAPQRRAAAARPPARPVHLLRRSPSAGSGRCATRGSAWRSTRSGGWAGTRCPAARSVRCGASEVNRTAAWLVRLTRRHDLPQKLFVLHQFRVDMVHDIRADQALARARDGPARRRLRHPAAEAGRRTTRSRGPGSSGWASSSSTTRTYAGWARARCTPSDRGSGSSASSDPGDRERRPVRLAGREHDQVDAGVEGVRAVRWSARRPAPRARGRRSCRR